MKATWLHISDLHIRSGDPYDRDVVLRALIRSVSTYRGDGRAADVIFVTGDIAHSGKAEEYGLATPFFDSLLTSAGLDRNRLIIVPGNHDVDRTQGIGLARTLYTREETDVYFGDSHPKAHIIQKLRSFRQWYDSYFQGIRTFSATSTCGKVEPVAVGDCTIVVLPLNTALFCQDDFDHAKLLVGRRSLQHPLKEMGSTDRNLRVALIHHPLDWLSDIERANVKASLQGTLDVVLRGHLHETDVDSVVSASGAAALHISAGAAYQTRKWPNRATYVTFDGSSVTVFPIRYEDTPHEIWVLDPSVFPLESGNEKSFPIPRFADSTPKSSGSGQKPASVPLVSMNIPPCEESPFVGRDQHLERVSEEFGDRARDLPHGWPRDARRAAKRKPYDVFISYSHNDITWVQKLAIRLRNERGIRVWLDRWTLIPGTNWVRELERGLDEAAACAICLGGTTPEGWFRQEIERAIEIQNSDPGFRVIPVLLPEAKEGNVGGFLRLRTWADFRVGQDEEFAFHVLVQGIRGEPVGPWPRSDTAPALTGLDRYARKIRELYKLEELGLRRSTVIWFERRILDDWYEEEPVDETR